MSNINVKQDTINYYSRPQKWLSSNGLSGNFVLSRWVNLIHALIYILQESTKVSYNWNVSQADSL